MIDWGALNNFKQDEFRCSCPCGRADMRSSFMLLLQSIRDEYGHVMPITSGFRCPARNNAVSSTGDLGPHVLGVAADVRVSGASSHRLLKIALEHGIQGVGVKQTGPHSSRFLHLDMVVSDGRPWLWGY